MLDLFSDEEPWQEPLVPGARVLRRFARQQAPQLLAHIEQIAQRRPFIHRFTPAGHQMSVAMTQCGDQGWLSERRFGEQNDDTQDPLPLDDRLKQFARQAAESAGYPDFWADNCLINRYDIGSKLTLHQDKSERDLQAPIVSVSLGVPAVFLFGGLNRDDATRKIVLEHGDVVVWGGPARLCYHGILPLKAASHPLTGHYRYNLTFRRAG